MPKSSPSRLPLAAALASTLLISPSHAKEAPEKESEKCMVWRFRGEKATVYIAGSIHILREADYPLPSPYEAAYADSSRVVFEIPPEELSSPETAKKMQAAGTYTDGETLDDHLGEDTLKAVDDYLEKSGMPATAKNFRPWMFSLMVSILETMKLGALPQFGIDKHFEQKAAEDEKETAGLESVKAQVGIFTGLPDEVQEQMLKKTLADLAELGDQFTGMLDAWKSGDTVKLEELMFEDADEFPDLMDAILIRRNKNWIDQIVGYLEGDENVMVIVGAGHLAGENSVIDLLEKQGFKGEQLSYLAAKKKAEK